MKAFITIVFFIFSQVASTYAQINPYSPLLPVNPTSADTITFRLPIYPYSTYSTVGRNPYCVSMEGNNITLTVNGPRF